MADLFSKQRNAIRDINFLTLTQLSPRLMVFIYNESKLLDNWLRCKFFFFNLLEIYIKKCLCCEKLIYVPF